MSENIELDFRDTGADKYLVIYAAVRSFKDSSSTGESEVFYEINEKNLGLTALVLMSLSGSVYADAPITDTTVINGDKTINVDTSSNTGIKLSGNKEVSLDAATPDATVVIKINGQRGIGDIRYGSIIENGAKMNLNDLSIISEDRTGDVNGFYAKGMGTEVNINNLSVDVSGNNIYGVNVNTGAQMKVAGDLNVTVRGDTVPASGIRAITVNSDSGRLDVKGNLIVNIESDQRGYGIYNTSGGTLTVDKDTYITNNSAIGHSIFSASNNEDGSIMLGGNLNVESHGNSAYAIRVIGGLVDVAGTTVMNMYGDNVSGIHTSRDGNGRVEGIVNLHGDTFVKIEGKSGKGIYASTGLITVDGKSYFEINGDRSNGIYADNGGKVVLNGGVGIVAQGSGAQGIYAYGGGNVELHETATIIADGDAASNAIRVNGAGSTTGDRSVVSGSALFVMQGSAFGSLTTESLSGSGGTIVLDIDGTAVGQSDKLYVTDTFTGTQALQLHEINGRDNDPTLGNDALGTVLASVNNNSGTFTAVDGEGSLFWQRYELGQQASESAGFTTDWYLAEIVNRDPVENPTTSVETVQAGSALNYYTWRTENDKMLQRIGELRHNGDAAKGAWFRVSGSKIGRSGAFGFGNKYTNYELGYDEVVKRTEAFTRYNGVALNYTDGSSSYSSGSGENHAKGISFYGTQIGSKGHYLDVVFKISHLDNDFAVYDSNARRITGEFENVGVALSAEYGRKNDMGSGWYLEPQAQLTLGYLGGDTYKTSNDLTVRQSGINSAVGRLGFNLGRDVSDRANVYVKANLLHEFGGSHAVTMTDSLGNSFTADTGFNDTWFEYGVGATFTTGTNSHIYFDVERSTGSDFKKDWQWNAGARWTF